MLQFESKEANYILEHSNRYGVKIPR